MVDLSLYSSNLHAEYEWYDGRQVKSGLDPYRRYLARVKEYHEKSGITLDYRPCSTKAGQFWTNLDGLGEGELSQVYDLRADCVYEFEPASDEYTFRSGNRIEITGRDSKEKTLRLEREPTKPKLAIRRNSYPIARQLEAVRTLLFAPSREHIPLLKLFHGDGVEWPSVDEPGIDEWFVLTGETDGIREQREFVKKALGTPDFAFLEGPPGSGKTTVLCELVRQIVSRGKRVLFCASTHVAVDNLLERLVGGGAESAGDIMALRIGESERISERIDPYRYDNFVKTKRGELLEYLSAQKAPSAAQKALRRTLEEGDDAIGRIARECANLVCGTTIGILAHPDIRDGTLRRFDFMIIDEASKTTLQEFLVPALHADRWIIVGDTRQLAPYTDERELAMHVDSCIEPILGEACLDAFGARRHGRACVVVTDDDGTRQAYRGQCERLGVDLEDADGSGAGPGRIVIGAPSSIANLSPHGIGRNVVVRGRAQLLGELRRKGGARAAAWRKYRPQNPDDYTWGRQVGWRIRSLQAHSVTDSGRRKIEEEIDYLMPGGDETRRKLEEVRAIALPSVLECLEGGSGTAGGIPARDFESRHVRLAWQYRMHPDIAAFSHRHVYGGEALNTPDYVVSRRDWSYREYASRSVWINVRGKTHTPTTARFRTWRRPGR